MSGPSFQYENFDLLIDLERDSYRARVLQSPVGQANVQFNLPFKEDELASLFGMAGRVTRSLRLARLDFEEAIRPAIDARLFGEQLYSAVFGGPVGSCLLRSIDATDRNQKGLRIRLWLDSDVPELADLPWEYLYSTELGRFIALSGETAIVRYLQVSLPMEALRVSPPLSLLVIISDPTDVSKLDVEQEYRRLHEALKNLLAQELITVERLARPTMAALQDRLRKEDIHLIHYIGHGYFDSEANYGGLVLENEDRTAHYVPSDQLGALLHDHEALRLLFLNACEGARGGRDDAFAGTAQHLVTQGLPAVVAMQFEVSDQAAITLAQEFYEAMTDGYPADAALAEARKAVFNHEANVLDVPEWGTPVLFSRSDDNQILILPEGDALKFIETQQFEPETVLVAGGPFLMGSDNDDDDERPMHEVHLPDFRIGKAPITNAQYAEFIKRNPQHTTPKKPDWFLRRPPLGKDDHPVVGVSWYDAQAYCEWLSQETGRRYRLPTEAEWEKAARGSDGRRYPWGDEWGDEIAAQRVNCASGDTTAVSEHTSGASRYGCIDMLGNVQEWTQTLWGSSRSENRFPYPYQTGGTQDDPDAEQHMSNVYRIHRGGSFRSRPETLRCSDRGISGPHSAVRWRGFRIVMVISSP